MKRARATGNEFASSVARVGLPRCIKAHNKEAVRLGREEVRRRRSRGVSRLATKGRNAFRARTL